VNDRNQNQNQRRDSREREPAKAQPWNVLRMKEVPPEERKDPDKPETRFIECGVAWPMKNREGFTFTLEFAAPEGARLAIMPRQAREDR
jgi:hypothetical protein